MRRGLIIGIDLCDDYTQIACYDQDRREPVSLTRVRDENRYQIPTVMLYSGERDNFIIGDEACREALTGNGKKYDSLIENSLKDNTAVVEDREISYRELLTIYLRNVLKIPQVIYQSKNVDMVVVTVKRLSRELTNMIKDIFAGELEVYRERVHVKSHMETYMYYALSQEDQLKKKDIGLFNFGEEGLEYSYLRIPRVGEPKVVTAEDTSYASVLNNNSFLSNLEEAEADKKFLSILASIFDKNDVFAVYLTGKYFEDEEWAKESLKYMCTHRRVFKGQNLYVKGACYCAYEYYNNDVCSNGLICNDTVMGNITIDVLTASGDTPYKMIRAGENWCEQSGYIDFIIRGRDKSLELNISGGQEDMIKVISLERFGVYDGRMTRLRLEYYMESTDIVKIRISDRGFGEIFRSSGEIITEEIDL